MDHLKGSPLARIAGEGAVMIVIGKAEFDHIVESINYLREQIKLLSPAGQSQSFLPECEVVASYGVSSRTLRRMRDRGLLTFSRGPGRKKGYSYFYLKGDLEKYLTKKQRRSFAR